MTDDQRRTLLARIDAEPNGEFARHIHAEVTRTILTGITAIMLPLPFDRDAIDNAVRWLRFVGVPVAKDASLSDVRAAWTRATEAVGLQPPGRDER